MKLSRRGFLGGLLASSTLTPVVTAPMPVPAWTPRQIAEFQRAWGSIASNRIACPLRIQNFTYALYSDDVLNHYFPSTSSDENT